MIVKGNRLEYYHKRFVPQENENTILFHNKIPSSFTKSASQSVIPEQNLNETISVYTDAIPYIKCQIQSTIQHEAGHRDDEAQRNKSDNPMDFQQFTSESRAEPIAERKELDCDSMAPPQVGGEVTNISLSQLFEEAKSAAQISPEYKKDIKSGFLDPSAQGQYLVQDMPGIEVKPGSTPNTYEGFDGTLWVDVRKIAQPFIVKGKSYSPTTQFDGSQVDPDKIRQDLSGAASGTTSVPTVPSAPSVPSVGSR